MMGSWMTCQTKDEEPLYVENAEAIREAEVLVMETAKDRLKPGIGLPLENPGTYPYCHMFIRR